VRTNIRQKLYADHLRRSVQQSIEMALYDALTGLNNRRSLERRLPAMIETARQRSAPLTMMVLDIDHFKRVNDTHGHAVGDLVLKGFAARLQEIVRGGDLLCRLGGEEFVVAMPGVDGTQAARIAERARRTTESREFAIEATAGSVSVTVSIGVAEWREKWDSAELYRRADRALYLSKSAGRNRVTKDAA
jgi:two-component system cell cycle response regulator